MRKLIQGFFVTSILATSLTFAQTSTAPTHTPPTPATMAAHKVAFLTSLLTLTSDQQTKATTIFTNAATADATARTNLKTLQTQLDTAIKSNAVGTINNLTPQIGALEGQLLNNDALANAAFYQILTPDQQAKLASSHRGGFGPMSRFGGPGPRFHGPRGGAAQ